jgi:hypothetical protein
LTHKFILTIFALYSDYQNNVLLIEPLNEVRSRGVFLSNKIIRTAVFYWQTATSLFARHTATTHPVERQVVTGISAVVPSRCRFEATGGMQDLVSQKNIP